MGSGRHLQGLLAASAASASVGACACASSTPVLGHRFAMVVLSSAPSTVPIVDARTIDSAIVAIPRAQLGVAQRSCSSVPSLSERELFGRERPFDGAGSLERRFCAHGSLAGEHDPAFRVEPDHLHVGAVVPDFEGQRSVARQRLCRVAHHRDLFGGGVGGDEREHPKRRGDGDGDGVSDCLRDLYGGFLSGCG